MYTQGNHFSCNRLGALYAHVISKVLLLREKYDIEVLKMRTHFSDIISVLQQK